MDENLAVLRKYDKIMETEKWCTKMPHIRFPEDWEIAILPPFKGAVVRFAVRKGNAGVSVFLDCYDILEEVGEPYWELYPCKECFCRVAMEDIDELLQRITESIEQQNASSISNIPT